MGKKTINIFVCFTLVFYQLLGVIFIPTAKAASLPQTTQELNGDWLSDIANGFDVIEETHPVESYNNNGIYFDYGSVGSASMKIIAAEDFGGGVFDLKSLVIEHYDERQGFDWTITGHDASGVDIATESGTVNGVPGSNVDMVYTLEFVHLNNINSFTIYISTTNHDLTASVDEISKIWNFDFKEFTIANTSLGDSTPPELTNVTMSSSNNNSTMAKVGDVITLDIIANEDINPPTITIAGNTVTPTDKSDGNPSTWLATYTLQSSDIEGTIPFTINYSDLAGNNGTEVTSVTSGMAVIFDKTKADDITLSSSSIYEKKPIGTAVGTLSATDPNDGSETFTYSLHAGDTSAFTINGTTLKTAEVFDFNTKNSYSITIRATDDVGNTFDKAFTINVTENQTPTGSVTINSDASHTNSTSVSLTNTASDAENEAIEMRFSDDDANWNSWEEFNASKLYTLPVGDGTKTVYMQLRDSTGNISTSYSDTIELDTTPPVVTGINDGDKTKEDVTIEFNEGTATLDGDPFTSAGTVSTEGDHILIVTDAAGNSTSVNFTIDKTIPTASIVTLTSNSTEGATEAKVGDELTLALITNESISTPSITIAKNTATIIDDEDGDASTWKATYTLQESDTEGDVSFTVDFQDEVGNVATQVTTTTDGSAVTFDKTAPTGTVTYSTDDPTNGNVTATLTIDAGVTVTNNEGRKEYTFTTNDSFTFELRDAAGNTGTATATVSNIDKNVPTLTTVEMTSTNANSTTKAKIGDEVTLTFVANELIADPTVTIGGNAATVSDNEDDDATTWRATYTMAEGDTEGTIAFTIDFADLVGNDGTEVTTVTSGVAVTFDKTAPTGTIDYNTTDPTNEDVIATLNPSEDVTITNNNGETTFIFTTNASFTFEFIDGAGNVGSATATVANIDITPPVVTGISDGDKVNEDVTITFDEGAATLNNNVFNNGDTVTEEGDYTLIVTDEAGNETHVTFKIDQTAPKGTIVYSITEPTREKVTATLSLDEAATITNNGGSATYEFTWNGTFTFEFVDEAGNIGSETATVNNIRSISSPSPTQPTTEEITVDIEIGNPGQGSTVTQTKIKRTRGADGIVRDEVTYQEEQARETIKQVKETGQTTARIVIPDSKDEVSQVDVTIPRDAFDALAQAGINLEISTANGRVTIPKNSLQGFEEDLYFRIVPIKEDSKRKEVEDRARVERIVKEISNGRAITILGRPMTIETNMQGRAVELVLPLKSVTLPTDAEEREQFLSDLVVFIEHSDGERELTKVEVVPYEGNEAELGVKFIVNKFSTFTILNMEGWGEYEEENTLNARTSYINGFPDGTFRAGASITRAQMAAILARNLGYDETKQVNYSPFKDVSTRHHALGEIAFVKELGIMNGDEQGNFRPGDEITRAQMATIVVNYKQLDVMTNTPLSFTDTTKHWARWNIEANLEAGIIKGYQDGTFKPNAALTRAQAVVMMNRMFERGPLYGVTTPSFPDVQPTHWAFEEIESASRDYQYTLDQNGMEWIHN
ncbi:S-layer homology domain-containing protein [Bacillus solitudinis]|uniref:S-layer homology domain-containing protein n=1 Tax=Bacillus solitudinis TaxID=2014074 RepID=UPI000C246EE4|nr:S-layer homology domain-containing protein [Bacillus solitudinis]